MKNKIFLLLSSLISQANTQAAQQSLKILATKQEANQELLAAPLDLIHGTLRIINALDHGADINATTNNSGETALIYAVIFGNYDVITALLYNSADANIQNKHGYTALMTAALLRFTDAKKIGLIINRLIVDFKADVNKCNEKDGNKTVYDYAQNNPETLEAIQRAITQREVNEKAKVEQQLAQK